jgi:hypothetical protein
MLRSLALLSCSLLLACGAADRLRAVIECGDDMQCPAGTICSVDSNKCVAVDGDEVSSMPPPKTSADLYSRFGRMTFTAVKPSVTQQISFGGDPSMLAQSIELAAINARVETDANEPRLRLWALTLIATGGSLTIWPLPARGTTITVPIRRVEITLPAEVVMPLSNGAYPIAEAQTEAPLHVIAMIGDGEDASFGISTHLHAACVGAQLNVVDGRLALRLHLEAHVKAEANESWLRVENLVLDLPLAANNDVPQRWIAE